MRIGKSKRTQHQFRWTKLCQKCPEAKNMSKKGVPEQNSTCPKDKNSLSQAEDRVSRKIYSLRRGLFYGVLGVSHNKVHFVYI